MSNDEIKKETERIYRAYRAEMDKLISKADEDIRAGKIRVQSIEDFDRLVKLDLLLMGEPTERKEVITKDSPLNVSALLDKLEAYVADNAN
jgi:hypothetical protein